MTLAEQLSAQSNAAVLRHHLLSRGSIMPKSSVRRLAFLLTLHSAVLICAALAMESLAGLIRMAQGAHFLSVLSDVAFAGIFMCVSVAGLHLLIIDAQPLWRRAASALADRRGRNDRNH
jgi:hypothetical protein